MAALTEANVEAILANCGANAAALAESLSDCFGRSYRLELGESGVWSPGEVPAALNCPGVLAVFQVESQGLAVLVPESLPLPAWCAQPNEDEQDRLDALAAGWATHVLPAEIPAETFRAQAVSDLSQAVASMHPVEWAARLELAAIDADQEGQPATKLFVVWPFARPLGDDRQSAAVTGHRPAAVSGTVDPLARLRHLPVQVSVRLAEKKILMSQLLGISPGMLIPFNKSCEDLLDLYVNNARYCRGEAVKIGENFGLKINQVGVRDEVTQKVIDA